MSDDETRSGFFARDSILLYVFGITLAVIGCGVVAIVVSAF